MLKSSLYIDNLIVTDKLLTMGVLYIVFVNFGVVIVKVKTV